MKTNLDTIKYFNKKIENNVNNNLKSLMSQI